ncbi:aminotransferase class I/II-fold pyridoxal phosphate-dependent enzyme [Granulicella sp. 5B5]|uniref:aminotransferase class I/II-fold pyridoxal phosphate-dependent enzyme n=1 Tax=Granulicella sp. 5B5 TaxID=1617967 RepID=UPI0015F7845F|nr:aminotransferase class I/II-fold pyridoxal phosphate-dependent enzyme [Granulicella sp. 5B5]QMV17533.1 aminotransferase class I/II-fold pyridoxal phosphate-dependent enzyme [Granulicella sp. 5B5]
MSNDLTNCSVNGVSRRSFLRTLGAASAAAAALPATGAFAQQKANPAPSMGGRRGGFGSDMGEMRVLNPDTVIISSNENPLGPATSSLDALIKTASMGGRYHQEEAAKTTAVYNDLFGLKRGYTALGPGSGGLLDLALMSNLGPDKPLVYGDPSYEQGPRAADTMGAPKFPVKLTPTYAHDVKAMLAAHPSPGAYYIVNPNNPTGTMTPRADILWLLKNKPKGSVVIVDEAYFHFSNDESVLDQVAADQDIIVLRTFSKIYGMAGLRAGFAAGRPDLLRKFTTVAPPARSLASISITSAAAARAGMLDKDLIPTRKKINADNRAESLEFLTKKGYTIIPGSQANFFMVDVKRPGHEFQQAMLKENVAIGRTWSAMPTYVRVTVGTKEEMAKFQTAFVKCMDMPTSTTAELYIPEHHIPTELYRG